MRVSRLNVILDWLGQVIGSKWNMRSNIKPFVPNVCFLALRSDRSHAYVRVAAESPKFKASAHPLISTMHCWLGVRNALHRKRAPKTPLTYDVK